MRFGLQAGRSSEDRTTEPAARRPPSQIDELLGRHELSQSPFPVCHQLRSHEQVCWSGRWGCWLLTRYGDVASVRQDSKHFSSVGRVTNVLQHEWPSRSLVQAQPLIDHYSHGLINPAFA